jgi:hypothetical protein
MDESGSIEQQYNTDIYVYFHVCCINNWKDTFLFLYANIKHSGLYSRTRAIRCNILSPYPEETIAFFQLLCDNKIEIIGLSDDISLHEIPTINMLHRDACSATEDYNILYIHTKGVRHRGLNPHVIDWMKYLAYFNIYRYDLCLSKLKEYDTVGVNMIKYPHPTLHYSGNFWWSKTQYIRTLEPCVYQNYNSPEFWLTEKEQGKFCCLWNSHVDHYIQPYREEQYVRNSLETAQSIQSST